MRLGELPLSGPRRVRESEEERKRERERERAGGRKERGYGNGCSVLLLHTACCAVGFGSSTVIILDGISAVVSYGHRTGTGGRNPGLP